MSEPTQEISSSNKRIAKNTVLLYFRTFITMVVSLYTSRVVLAALGFEDFGIWNVVGGIVAMFLFIKESLSSVVNRFLTFAIGTGDQQEIDKAFSTSIIIHVILGVLIVLFVESVGLWFLAEKLVIPAAKMGIAYKVFHISVISTFFSIVTVPFHSALISYERMDVYAYLGLWDAFAKLLIAFAVTVVSENRLVVYGLLILASSLSVSVFIVCYVRKTFPKMRAYFVRDKQMYRSVFAFSGWSLLGNIAWVGYSQGINMVINMFFGPVVNAARAISSQIEQSVRTFVTNFQTAVNPQIIKNCAAGDWSAMHLLMFRSSKFSAYLLFLFALPIVLEVDTILVLWLKNVPEHSASFCRIMFAVILLETMANPIQVGVSANGDIRKWQTVISAILLTIVPLSYAALYFGMPPESVFVVYLVVEIFACVARVWIAREKIHLPMRRYLIEVVAVIAYVMALAAVLPLVLHLAMPDGLLRFFVVLLLGFATSCASIYFLGLDAGEKAFVYNKIVRRVIRKQ